MFKKIAFYFLVILFLSSCKGQDKDKITTIEDNHLIGKAFIIDQYNYKNDVFNSKKLDALFKKDNYNYLIGEYSGTSKENFDCKIIGLFNNNVYEKSFALFYDKNEILRDTLNITNKDISLNVLFGNNKRGIALGKVDTTNIKDVYFKITDLYELDSKTIKLKKVSTNQKIIKCEIPIEYLSEEYVGIEDYFNYGINTKSPKKETPTTVSSTLKGLWAVNCQNELTELDINESEGNLSLYDFNEIYINLKVEKSFNKNEYSLYFNKTTWQKDYYKDRLSIVDEDIDKSKPIGKLILLENGKARLEWVGLYNLKKQQLEFVGKDFLLIKENGGKLPLILERCS